MPDYTVAMTCYLNDEERLDYLNQTLEAMWIKIDPKPSRVLISAEVDGVSPGLCEALRLMADHRGAEVAWHRGPADLGANLNFMLGQVRTDLLLYLQEDWLLHRLLDIGPDLRLLAADSADFVQYWWWPDTPEALGHRLEFDGVAYHRIRPEGQINWYYRDNPYLARRDAFARIGPFPEYAGKRGSGAEYHYSQMARQAGVRIYGRGEDPGHADRYFRHIGAVSAIHGRR